MVLSEPKGWSKHVCLPEPGWWVVIDCEGVDLCQFDPGNPVTGTVETDVRTLTRIWRGQLTWPQSQRAGGLCVDGP